MIEIWHSSIMRIADEIGSTALLKSFNCLAKKDIPNYCIILMTWCFFHTINYCTPITYNTIPVGRNISGQPVKYSYTHYLTSKLLLVVARKKPSNLLLCVAFFIEFQDFFALFWGPRISTTDIEGGLAYELRASCNKGLLKAVFKHQRQWIFCR